MQQYNISPEGYNNQNDLMQKSKNELIFEKETFDYETYEQEIIRKLKIMEQCTAEAYQNHNEKSSNVKIK